MLTYDASSVLGAYGDVLAEVALRVDVKQILSLKLPVQRELNESFTNDCS